ncbi:hypothetical protein GGR57DRAFT_452152 [Xylariaceae sp. FL1272]|nr:hypothetical protein GGR57DRAFT_452152 [Xylariaceae sp. FL1272]
MDGHGSNDSVFRAVDVGKFVYRRQRYDTNCRYVAKHRDTTFKQFSMAQLIPVAFYTISSDIEKMSSLEPLVTVACQMYESDKADLYSDSHKYCKALSTEYRALAILECASTVAAQYILDASKRNVWFGQCHDQLVSFKELIRHSDVSSMEKEIQKVPARKRRKLQHHENNNVTVHTARMAQVQELKNVLGAYLFVGIKTSRMRKQEGLVTLTDAVRLQLAPQEGDDFRLILWVESSIGGTISGSNSESVEALHDALGNYIFEGMMASKTRKAETQPENTGAVIVNHPRRDEDSVVEIMLCFSTGKELYATIYPS